MSFMALANEHSRCNTLNQNHLSDVLSNRKMHIPNKLKDNFDIENMPFYNSTLKRSANPFMNTIRNKYEHKLGDETKYTFKPDLFEPKLSPRVKINITNYSPAPQMHTGASMPFQKDVTLQGILKNTID